MADAPGDRPDLAHLVELVSARSAEFADLAAYVAGAGVVAEVAEVAQLFVDVYRAGGQVLAFGNGGSAAEASHLAAEFVGRCTRDRGPLPALALGDSPATVTAVANDYGYEQVFARQIQAYGRPGDLAVAFTTSGRSPNVLAGLSAARERGLRSVAFTGAGGTLLAGAADHVLSVPSEHSGRVQEVHQLWSHLCAEAVEQTLFT